MAETAISWMRGDDWAYFHASDVWSRNLAEEWLEKHPEKVQLIHRYEDAIELKVPPEIIKTLRWPNKLERVYTEEEREVMRERAKKMLAAKKAKEEEDAKNGVVKPKRGRPKKNAE